MRISRRSLLGAGAASLGTGFLSMPLFAKGSSESSKSVKNIIFCVADGMAMSAITSSDEYQELAEGKRSFWSQLMDDEDVVNGLQDCRSLSSIVTDSSAASSTWGSGRRIWNSQVNEFPDGTKLRPIASIMLEHGIKVGLVTTTTITHATPAGFGVSIDDRDNEAEIAKLYLSSGIDVLMGGGDRYFSAELRKDKLDLYSEFSKKGYKVVKDRSALNSITAGKTLGVFSNSHTPYSVDRNHSPELQTNVPTIKEMAAKAIDLLKVNPNGFLLQIEGGRVDHGAHSNDTAGWLYDQMAFEDAVRYAVEFARKDGETLVVVTTDHACGGPSLNGAGFEYFDSTAGLKSLAAAKSSYGPLLTAFGKTPDRSMVQNVTRELLGAELTAVEADSILAAMKQDWPIRPSEFMRSVNATLGSVLGNHSKITWTSGNHTSDYCLLTAVGPGRENFHGLVENRSIFDKMLSLKGLKWSNPTMSYADAKKAWDAKHPPEKIELDEMYSHSHELEVFPWLESHAPLVFENLQR